MHLMLDVLESMFIEQVDDSIGGEEVRVVMAVFTDSLELRGVRSALKLLDRRCVTPMSQVPKTPLDAWENKAAGTYSNRH